MATTKQQALKIVNPIIGILFIIQAATGIFHAVIPYEVFDKLHGPVGFLLAAGVTTHIILNWNWFKSTFTKRKMPAAKT
jgi:hypothetical protein